MEYLNVYLGYDDGEVKSLLVPKENLDEELEEYKPFWFAKIYWTDNVAEWRFFNDRKNAG